MIEAPPIEPTGVIQFDVYTAESLHGCLEKQGRVSSYSQQEWATRFSVLRSEVGNERVLKTVKWYIGNYNGMFVPDVRTAAQFIRKFKSVERLRLSAEYRAEIDKELQTERRDNGTPAAPPDWARKIPYSEYLTTDHWKELRKAVLKRAKWRCQLCNAATQLDAHHRTYERLGEELIEDLTALCRLCHEKFHDILPSPPVSQN